MMMMVLIIFKSFWKPTILIYGCSPLYVSADLNRPLTFRGYGWRCYEVQGQIVAVSQIGTYQIKWESLELLEYIKKWGVFLLLLLLL